MPERKYKVKLAATQREIIQKCSQINNSLKSLVSDSAKRKRPLELTRSQLETLEIQLSNAYHEPPDSIKQERVERLFIKIGELINDLDDDLYDAIATRQEFKENADQVLQFKIRLQGSRPRIWRRFQVDNVTLGDFHMVIQFIMGWDNSHLHQFDIDRVFYEPAMMIEDFGFGPAPKNENSYMLSDVLPKKMEGKDKFWFSYIYDMGDDWHHEVTFEGYQPRQPNTNYPICMGGENACPPEDVGGMWGFYDFLNAISDPTDSDHEHFVEWIGEYDPIHFDADEINMSMRRSLKRTAI